MDIEDLLLRSLKGTTERRPLARACVCVCLDIVMTSVVRFALLHSYFNFFPCFHLYFRAFRESECSKLFHRQLLQKHENLQNTREICAVWIIIDG